MTALRRAFAALFCLLAGVAFALTPNERVLLFAGIKPVWQANFLGATSLPSGLTYTGASLATMFDSTGTLTYKPNNLYINSNSATNTARTISTTAGINYYIWIQTSSGSATVVASGTNTTTFNGSSGGTFTAFTATTGTLTLTPTSNYANITQVVVAAITYESAMRSGDNVVTGASTYYGSRFVTNPATLAPAGLLVEPSSAGNLLKTSNLFTSNWINYASKMSTTQNASGIDGLTSAWTAGTSAGSGQPILYQIISASSATNTLSFYVKAGTWNYVYLNLQSVSINNYITAVFDLSSSSNTTATQTAVGSGSGTIAATSQVQVGGFYRITLTGSGTSLSYAQIGFANSATGNSIDSSGQPVARTWAGSETFIFTDAQLEPGSVATSYMPNPTSSSPGPSRAADAVTPTTYAAKATIWQRKSESAGTTARTYYAPGALPSPFDTGYWYQSMAAYPRALTTAEQTPRLVVGAPY